MTTPLLKFTDKNVATFGRDLDVVMKQLNAELVNLLITGQTVDAAVILNSRAAMTVALNQAGYLELSNEFVGQYPAIAEKAGAEVSKMVGAGPSMQFSQPSIATMRGLARVDVDGFAAIGDKALDDLRVGLYRDVVSNMPVSALTERIAESTIGLAKNNSPMRNYAYTHANTSILNFSGEVLILAGEEIGADKWEVVGPLDSKTRPVCHAALAEPVRTKEQWIKTGYWGGTPGGWNCRHQLYPWFGDDTSN